MMSVTVTDYELYILVVVFSAISSKFSSYSLYEKQQCSNILLGVHSFGAEN